MKAVTQDRFGGPEVLDVRDVPDPVAGDGEVVVRVGAAGVNPLDWHYLRGEPLVMRPGDAGVRTPRRRVLGFEVAGTVEAVGPGVTRLKVHDEVWGWCGGGGFAEFTVAREDRLMRRPAAVGVEQAAAVPVAAVTALQAVRDHGDVQPGQRVLVIGASGGVGTFAVQIAVSLGAVVTGVCSTGNLDLVRSLGADEVIDYTTTDVAAAEQRYDVVLHVAGNRSFADCLRVATPQGIVVNVGGGEGRGRLLGPAKRFVAAALKGRFASQTVRSFISDANLEDGLDLLDLLETGRISPVIDRTYPLVETADALRYLETLRARGKVVVTVP